MIRDRGAETKVRPVRSRRIGKIATRPADHSTLSAQENHKEMESQVNKVNRLLADLKENKPGAAQELMPFVYQELHRLAMSYMRKERQDHTLQPTALVHEAYLRLVKSPTVDWKDKAHFFGIAANLMRRILIDHARQH